MIKATFSTFVCLALLAGCGGDSKTASPESGKPGSRGALTVDQKNTLMSTLDSMGAAQMAAKEAQGQPPEWTGEWADTTKQMAEMLKPESARLK